MNSIVMKGTTRYSCLSWNNGAYLWTWCCELHNDVATVAATVDDQDRM
jgi:hypothetical protein